MKAWRVHRYGNPSKALDLDELAVPEPGPDQVRVKLDELADAGVTDFAASEFTTTDGERERTRALLKSALAG